jgi:hypothetical protein
MHKNLEFFLWGLVLGGFLTLALELEESGIGLVEWVKALCSYVVGCGF